MTEPSTELAVIPKLPIMVIEDIWALDPDPERIARACRVILNLYPDSRPSGRKRTFRFDPGRIVAKRTAENVRAARSKSK